MKRADAGELQSDMYERTSAMCRLCAQLLAPLVVAPTLGLAQPGGPVIARDGASDYTLVRPGDSSPSQVYAAEELQRYVKEMTGAELPMVTDDQPLPAKAILLGVTRHTTAVLGEQPDMSKLGDDGFRLVTRPPHVCVIGSPVRGTLYGVHGLLETHGGCRWYAKHHSVIPKLDSWTLPQLDDTQVPAFAMREPFGWGMFDGDFAARCRSNGNRPDLKEKHGGKIRFGGGLFVHTFYPLMPPGEFFAEHPEFYSELNGKRTAERAQLCLTNPDVVRIMTERVLERIRKDPEAKLFSVSQNDWGGYCTCSKCRAIDEREGSLSGTLINFVNQVAEAVEKEFPDVWIETLAYQYTRHPPKTLKPRRNVVPRLCTIECDFSKPLDVSSYEQNRKFVEDIKGWSAITDKLYVWDYTTNFGHYLGPHPNFGALRGNAKFFRDNHVVGLFEQGAYQAPHAEFAELRAWVLAKLLWNPDQEVEPLYADFFNGYYGPAAKPIRAYFDELQALVMPADNVLRIWLPPTSPYYTDEFFDRAAKLWAEAEELVKGDPALSYNVRMSAMPVLYARLERWPKMAVRQEWRDGMLKPVGVAPEYAALAQELLARIAEGKVTHLCESSERHAAYLSMLHSRTDGLKPVTISGGGLTAGLIAESGGRVVTLAATDGTNLLCPEAGGIDFADAAAGVAGIETDPYSVKAEGATATLRREVRGRYRIARTVDATDAGLTVTTTLTSTRTEPQTVYPVVRAALALGKAAGVLQGGTDEWVPLPVAEDQTFAPFSLAKPQLRSRSLLVAQAGTDRAVRLTLPEGDLQRVWFLTDAEREFTRAFALLAPQELPAQGSLSFSLGVATAGRLSSLPAIEAIETHRFDRLVVEDCMIGLGRPGEWGEIVADPEADDGFAMKLFNTHYEWCANWRFDLTQFAPGAQYKVRMRIRVDKTDRDGNAFWAGVYDTVKKKGFGQLQPQTSQVKDGYQWYDVATWTPEAGQYLWVGPGVFSKDGGQSAINALYVDKFELTRVE